MSLSYEILPPVENLDWGSLIFGYTPTDYNIRFHYHDGAWGDMEITSETTIPIHISAACLHYGQEAFEGLKAFRCPDGKVRVFRALQNARRMHNSALGLMMPPLPEDKFLKAVEAAVRLNSRFIPPYETGAALYMRPLLIGTTPLLGVKPAQDYTFVMFATPVGPYYKTGFKASPFVIMRGYDRAAPLGTGQYKVAGNYASSLVAENKAHNLGYSGILYLDAKKKKYIDECGAANFFAIKNGAYITPKSTSILPSITNDSLMRIATDKGIAVEQRQIEVRELAQCQEAGACGTGAVISPINRIDDYDTGESYIFSRGTDPGPVSLDLYNTLRSIQYGLLPDPYGWVTVLE